MFGVLAVTWGRLVACILLRRVADAATGSLKILAGAGSRVARAQQWRDANQGEKGESDGKLAGHWGFLSLQCDLDVATPA